MAVKKTIREKARAEVLKEKLNYVTIHCPLFRHMKDSRVCTVLRAKGVCRKDCPDYMEFAKNNRETIDLVIKKYTPLILAHLKKHDLHWDMVYNAYPRGEFVCEHCGKTYQDEGRYKSHFNKKHKKFLERVERAKEKKHGKTRRSETN